MLTSDALVRTRSLKGEEGKAVAAVGVGQEGVVLEVLGEEEEGEQNSAQD